MKVKFWARFQEQTKNIIIKYPDNFEADGMYWSTQAYQWAYYFEQNGFTPDNFSDTVYFGYEFLE